MIKLETRLEDYDYFLGLAHKHVWTPMYSWADQISPEGLNIFTEGKGCWIKDIKGRTYLDYWSSIMFNNVGYGRTEISNAVSEQLHKLHAVPTHDLSIPKIKLSKKLADITPGSLSKVFFTNSGTEAVESAIKIAWQYQHLAGYPNRRKIIVGGYRYHGSTYGAMSLGSRPPGLIWKEFEPLLPGIIHAPSPYCFRCELGLKHPSCNIQCAKHIEWIIEMERPETIAAFFDVTIATEYCTAPASEYWPMVRDICKKHGILLILDEVVNGFGRNGKMFACSHWDIEPDIIVIAKGLGSGYVPIGASVATEEIASKFKGGTQEALKHSHTFEGTPAGCVAALASIEIIEKENLVENSAKMGKYLLEKLESLKKYGIVGAIHGGLGLMCNIEFVKNKDNNNKMNFEEKANFVPILKKRLRVNGLWGEVANPLPLFPPLSITCEEIDELVNRLDKTICTLEKEIHF